MNKIDFGYNNGNRLMNNFEGIEMYNGEYVDLIELEGRDYLVTSIVDSLKGLDGQIDVREVLQDYYGDGGYDSYANQNKNDVCLRIQKMLNEPDLREKTQNGISPLSIFQDMNIQARKSKLRPIHNINSDYPGVLVSIKNDLFLDAKKTIGSANHSIYYMKKEIEESRKLLDGSREIESGNKFSR